MYNYVTHPTTSFSFFSLLEINYGKNTGGTRDYVMYAVELRGRNKLTTEFKSRLAYLFLG